MSLLSFKQKFSDFLDEEDAATAIEYAVMLALIVAVCAGAVSGLANATKDSFTNSGDAIAGAMGS